MSIKAPIPWEISFNSGLIIDANHQMVDLEDDEIKDRIATAVSEIEDVRKTNVILLEALECIKKQCGIRADEFSANLWQIADKATAQIEVEVEP